MGFAELSGDTARQVGGAPFSSIEVFMGSSKIAVKRKTGCVDSLLGR